MPESIENILENLENLKEQIAEAKQEKAEKDGALSEQMKALKSFGVQSLVDAKRKLRVLETEIAKLGRKIVTDYGTLREKYEW